MSDEKLKVSDKNRVASIIRIPDKFTVIIDKGFENSELIQGRKLVVYEAGPIIKDLDGNELGVYDFIKAEIKVTRIFANFSVCKYEKKETVDYSAKSLSPLFSQQNTYYAELNIEDDDIEPLTPKEPKVKVGDPVKYITN